VNPSLEARLPTSLSADGLDRSNVEPPPSDVIASFVLLTALRFCLRTLDVWYSVAPLTRTKNDAT
jgi:hypothetical protein